MAESAIVLRTASGERKVATQLVNDPTFGDVHLLKVVIDSMPAGGAGLTDAELRAAAVPVTVGNIPHIIVDSMPAGGAGLTDAELRASAVPVSLVAVPAHAVTGPLTDAQLRALAVPVSGAFWQATQPVSGSFWQATQPVSGPLTDTELRASAPHVIVDSMPAGGAGLTDAELRATAVAVSGTFWQGTQPVSGTFWQATQPVSGPLTDAQLRAAGIVASDQKKNRVEVNIYAEALAGIIAETINTMNESVGGGAPGAGTSIGPTSGKTLRLIAMALSWIATATTVNNCRVRVRVNPAGAAIITSPIQFSTRIGFNTATWAIGQVFNAIIPLPEGIEIPSGGAFCTTRQCTAANGTLDISFIGYEYTP